MAIKITDIPPEGLQLEIAQELDLFESGEGTTSAPVAASLSINPADESGFHITGRVQCEPMLECSRCLSRFPYRIDTKLNVDLSPLNAVASTPPEHEIGKGELDTEFYEGDEIDPLDIVREQLLLAIPMVPLHDSGCKGLCPVCGTNRNEADCRCDKGAWGKNNAFSVLKDIFKKKKE